MKLFIWSIAIALSGIATLPATAHAENLESVESQVYTMAGSRQHLLARAQVCIPQVIRPGAPGMPLIVDRDEAAGMIVVDLYSHFSARLITWAIHSHMTFEAKDGRFRIVHSGIEETADPRGPLSLNPGWVPVSKDFPNPWKHAQKSLEDSSAKLSECMMRPAAASDW